MVPTTLLNRIMMVSALAVWLASSGCAPLVPAMGVRMAHDVPVYMNERGMLKRAMEFPAGHDHRQMPAVTLAFHIPAEKSDAAWKRAGVWIAQSSAFKLEQVTDTVMETTAPMPPKQRYGGFGFKAIKVGENVGFAVTRSLLADGSADVTVTCSIGDVSGLSKQQLKLYGNLLIPDADRRCHLLAWDMISGEDPVGISHVGY